MAGKLGGMEAIWRTLLRVVDVNPFLLGAIPGGSDSHLVPTEATTRQHDRRNSGGTPRCVGRVGA